MMKRSLLALLSLGVVLGFQSTNAPAATTPPKLPLYCRVINEGFDVLGEADLFTESKTVADRQFTTTLPKGQRVEVTVTNVLHVLPRDQFNTALKIDGKPYLMIGRQDEPFVVAFYADAERYRLVCFEEIEE